MYRSEVFRVQFKISWSHLKCVFDLKIVIFIVQPSELHLQTSTLKFLSCVRRDMELGVRNEFSLNTEQNITHVSIVLIQN